MSVVRNMFCFCVVYMGLRVMVCACLIPKIEGVILPRLEIECVETKRKAERCLFVTQFFLVFASEAS